MINLMSNTREKQIEQLKQVKKSLQSVNEEKWNRKYKLAKIYYENYGNLEVSVNFKTINGYDYDENGIALGRWIDVQRQAYKGNTANKITEEQIELLRQIGMRFETKNKEEEWNKKYELAKTYFERYRNLEMPQSFKTVNGYDYDESGIASGLWICTQRQAYKENKMSEERIKLLRQIGMRFETKNKEEEWNKKYELAKVYFEHYGNLEAPVRFKTKNGYEYDENGIRLGVWICTQKQAYKGQGKNKITEEQIELLKQIGMRFDVDKREEEWQRKYKLAKAYYDHHHNLEVPQFFKTVNGYDYDENGIALGNWINKHRQAYNGQGKNKITEEQIELLRQIGMRFETKNKEEEWNKKYELAKAYFEHYGNLEIPQRFKTVNGYDYDEKGITLGIWICTQRKAYKEKSASKITEEQIELLKQIGMRFETRNIELVWNDKYKLAKSYYEHYGNLEVSVNFKTVNGYDYDENGVALGMWVANQRQAYKCNVVNKISEWQIELLKQIGMRFETKNREEEWNKKYELAKLYYEYHGNLEIPQFFKTVNGYEYDENGFEIGNWLRNQRQAYKENRMSKKRIILFKQIGMRFETKNIKEEWNKKYKLAKVYYEHYGNLEIPIKFKTINGYEYDENGASLGMWISTQKQSFKGQANNKLDEKQIKLLNQIGMKWFSDNIDIKFQKEEINEKNINRKKIELYNRFIGYLSKYKTNELPSKEEINSVLIKELNKPLSKK